MGSSGSRYIFLMILAGFFAIPSGAAAGTDQYASGDYIGAIHAFEQDLAVGSGSARAPLLNNIGTCYVALGEPEKALSYYSQAVEANGSYGRGWINLGVVQEKLGKREDALACYDRVGIADPGLYAEAMVKKGSLLAGDGELDPALRAFRMAESGASGQVYVDLYTGIGAVEFLQKNTDAAEEAFLKATKADPDGAALAFTNLGVLRISQERYEEAKRLLETAARNDKAGQTNAALYLKKLDRIAGEVS